MTAEEFYAFTRRPENAERNFELDKGRVVELPVVEHGDELVNLTRLLCEHVTRRGKGDVSVNGTPVILSRNPDTVRGPDVMFHDDEGVWDALPEDAFLETPPLLVVEIVSPRHRFSHLARKLSGYERAGVPLVWIVDPPVREVTVCDHDRMSKPFRPGDILDGGGVLPGLSVEVAELFRPRGEK